eukprot:gene6895-7435_t
MSFNPTLCNFTIQDMGNPLNRVGPNFPVISQAPLPPAPLPFLRRFYVLFNLKRPAEMLERGVRDYIVSQMRGRAIGGMVYREKLPSYGQSVIIRACGTREALRSLETSVLSRDGNEYWEWDVDTPMYRDCEVEHISSHEFSIAESRRGAICGANSDPKNDNKSEKSSRTVIIYTNLKLSFRKILLATSKTIQYKE